MKQGSRFLGTALKLLIGLALLAVIGGVVAYGAFYYNATTQSITFKTEKVVTGDLTATISSTGTIEPEEVIDVGAEIAGQIVKFGEDPDDSTKTVDWRTRVHKDTVLAVLDPALYQARVDEVKATVRSAEADLVSKKASKAQWEREWNRAQSLKPSGGISLTEYDTAKANYETTSAAIGVSEAAIGLAKAQLAEANVNLGYTIIKSPVEGEIIDRRVNVGQTVVAGLSAPSLFLIAKDLKRIQVWVSVNEADIGAIKKGQEATFTVDAFPGEVFKGTVTKIRLNAMMTQNVVTYTVEVTTKNDDLRLYPYMTANVKFIVNERKEVQLVPNAALRWRPSVAHVHPDYRTDYEQSLKRKAVAASEGGRAGDGEKTHQNRGTVWIPQDGFARPVKVFTGLTDGANTEIVKTVADKDKDLLNGENSVIVSEIKGGPASTVNPFVTPMFGGKKKE